MARVYAVYGGFAGGRFVGSEGRMRGVNVTAKDEITPILNTLASGVVKKVMASAAHSTAFTAMKWVKLAINRGSAEGFGKIPDRKTLDFMGATTKVLDKFKPGKLKSVPPRVRNRLLAHLLHNRRRFGPQGPSPRGGTKNLLQAVNYAKLPNLGGAAIGWGSKSSPYWGNAVQEGLRGRPFGMSWKNSQMFTDKQRRFFAAIGLPIGKNKMLMTQPSANFFGPMMKHKERSGALGRVFNQKLDAALKREMARAAAKAASIGAAA